MTTIAELARELFGSDTSALLACAAPGDIPAGTPDTAELSPELEATIREAVASAPDSPTAD